MNLLCPRPAYDATTLSRTEPSHGVLTPSPMTRLNSAASIAPRAGSRCRVVQYPQHQGRHHKADEHHCNQIRADDRQIQRVKFVVNHVCLLSFRQADTRRIMLFLFC